jgi:hypothetical protein
MIVEKFEPSEECKILLRTVIFKHKEQISKVNEGKNNLKEFKEAKIPKYDLNSSGLKNSYILDSPLLENVKELLGAADITNNIMYPKNTIMGWHTNSETPGQRIYINFSKTPGIFRYKHPDTGKIIDDCDNDLWTGRKFIIDPDRPLWHTIWAPEKRFSFGFNKKL